MLARFMLPVKDGQPAVPREVLAGLDEWQLINATTAQALVTRESTAKYLRARRYAHEMTLPQGYVSISQVEMYLRCPAQYYYRYIMGLKVPPASAASFGIATHRAIEHNYKQKIESREDLPTDVVQDAWADAWNEIAETTAFEENEDPGQIKDEGVKVAALYMGEVAPTVQPVLVEHDFLIPIEGTDIRFRGIIDVVDERNVIHDAKTTKRSPDQDAISTSQQMTAYAIGHRAILGMQETGLRMEYMVRTKTPKIVTLEAGPRTDAEVNRLIKIAGQVQLSIAAGHWYPNQNSFLCSPKWCGYWDICHQDY